MDRNELPLHPCHLGVPSDAPKIISEPIARSEQTLHLSCIEINIISKRTEASFHLTHVTYESHRVRAKWFASLLHVQHKPCTYLVSRLAESPKRLKRASIWPASPRGVPLFEPKMIFKPMACSSQSMHLSCVEFNTVSKWTETSFHLSHVTSEFHHACPKQFVSLLRVWCKPCNYIVLRLIISLNGLNQTSTWPTSPRSSIRCAKNVFHAHGTSGTNRHLSCAEINTVFKQTETSFHLTHVT
jgi:hypothetical protein